jgi:hypothetical protein
MRRTLRVERPRDQRFTDPPAPDAVRSNGWVDDPRTESRPSWRWHAYERRRPENSLRVSPSVANCWGRGQPRRGSPIGHIPPALIQRLVPRGEQQGGHRRHVRQPQALPCTGDGANHLVMLAREPSGLLFPQPALNLPPRPLGTPPVATGMIPAPLTLPLGPPLHMPAQPRRATGQQRPYRLAHRARSQVAACNRRVALLQNLRHRHPDHAALPSRAPPSLAAAGSSNATAQRRAPARRQQRLVRGCCCLCI